MKKFTWVKLADYLIYILLWTGVVYIAGAWLVAGILVFPFFLSLFPDTLSAPVALIPAVLFLSYIAAIATVTISVNSKLRKINFVTDMINRRQAKQALKNKGHEVAV